MGRSDLQRFWGGRAGAEGAVGPDLVVLAAPALDEDLGLGQGGEDLRVETLVAERAVEGFQIPVLPGTARCDAERGHAEPLQPGAQGGRRAALHEERRQPGEDVVGAQAAWAWSRDDRERYANDLGYDHALVAVSARSNRAKGARDPAEWLPPEESAHCWYAAAWITVKVRWDLTVDSAEADTLRRLIAGCDGDPAGPAPADPPADDPPPESIRCHPAYDPCLPDLPGDALNCGDLTPAQKPVRVRVIGVDPYQLDRDGDGLGCTS